MTLYEALSAFTSAASLVVVAVTVLMLRSQLKIMAAQTRQLQATLEISAEASLDNLLVAVSDWTIQHPELRPIFNDPSIAAADLAQLDDDTKHRADAVAESMADAMERALRLQSKDLPGQHISRWVDDTVRTSLYFRSWLETHQAWYDDLLTDRLQEYSRTERH